MNVCETIAVLGLLLWVIVACWIATVEMDERRRQRRRRDDDGRRD